MKKTQLIVAQKETVLLKLSAMSELSRLSVDMKTVERRLSLSLLPKTWQYFEGLPASVSYIIKSTFY